MQEDILDLSETTQADIAHNDNQATPCKRKRTHKDNSLHVKESDILQLEKYNLLQKQYLNLKITAKKQELQNLLLQEKIMKAQLEKHSPQLPKSHTENEI